MQGDKQVIAFLNAQLKNELTAVNQYFLHARMLKNWGYERLGEHEYRESVEEMKHADRLIERILMLDGAPSMQALGKLAIGRNVPEVLAGDLQLERTAQKTLKEGIACSEAAQDFVSRGILAAILDDTEEHIDFLETQIALIDEVGLQNYLQSQMKPL